MKKKFHSTLLRVRFLAHMIGVGSSKRYREYIVDQDDHHRQAKKLHAETYLRKGFVLDHHIDDEGFIRRETDPHQLHSQYFVVTEVVKGKEVVKVTARQILAAKKLGFGSFPIMNQADIYPHIKGEILKHKPEECVEFSGLAKARGIPTFATFLVYRLMWQHSRKEGHKVWLMALAPDLYTRLKQFVGPAIVQIGDRSPYIGEDVIPAMVKVQEADAVLRRAAKSNNPGKRLLYKMVLRFFLNGLDKSDQVELVVGR